MCVWHNSVICITAVCAYMWTWRTYVRTPVCVTYRNVSRYGVVNHWNNTIIAVGDGVTLQGHQMLDPSPLLLMRQQQHLYWNMHQHRSLACRCMRPLATTFDVGLWPEYQSRYWRLYALPFGSVWRKCGTLWSITRSVNKAVLFIIGHNFIGRDPARGKRGRRGEKKSAWWNYKRLLMSETWLILVYPVCCVNELERETL
jgi:hypothetical protein